MSDRRYNIGIVVANLIDSFSERAAKGAMDAAEKLDANLFIFPMKYIDINYDIKENDTEFEYQFNMLYKYAAESRLDYLIICIGSIAYISDNTRKKELLDLVKDTPLVSIAANVEGYDFLQYDNTSGISEAVDYLASQGRKHICMMTGFLSNTECAERYRAYRNGLEKNRLPFSEEYTIESDMSQFCEKEVYQLIERNPGVDAILCANDDIAAVVYKVLNAKGISIGSEVAVVGFDDMPFASQLNPPLATIKADAYGLGYAGVLKAVRYLNGSRDNINLLPSRFVLRSSCMVSFSDTNDYHKIFADTTEKTAENMMNFVFQDNVPASKLEIMIPFYQKIADILYYDFVKSKATEEKFAAMQKLADAYFSDHLIQSELSQRIISLINMSYSWLKDNAPEENQDFCRRLFELFTIKVTMYINAHFKVLEDNEREHTHDINLFVRDTLMFSGSMKIAYAEMMKKFYMANIRSSYLFTLPEPIEYHEGEDFPEIDHLRFQSYQLGMEYSLVPPEERDVSPSEIYTNKYIDTEKRHTFIIVDLYSRDLQYGLLLCETDSAEFFRDVELIVYQVSAAVKIIRLLRQQDKILEKLHDRNTALMNISGIDELTGVYNRRGFYRAADELVERSKGEPIICCYADMDNLKMVNDNYGHSEGDFAIKMLARGFKVFMGTDAVIARMGGDEFVAVFRNTQHYSIEELIQRKKKYITTLNEKAGKPYLINMSMGLYECVCNDSYDLKAALDKADALLYDEKSKRVKKI